MIPWFLLPRGVRRRWRARTETEHVQNGPLAAHGREVEVKVSSASKGPGALVEICLPR